MNRLYLLVVVFILLFIGGALTTMLSREDASGVVSTVKQTNDPAASVMEVESWQAEQLFLFVLFVLASVIGMATAVALVMWFLNRQIVAVKVVPVRSE